MYILGLSSATKIISLALIDETKVVVETTLADIQSEKIIYYLAEAGVKPEQIGGLAVAMGPGSYSGLRGGLAVAKTLAQTLKIPLVGISTLEAMAYNLISTQGTMVVLLDAKADDYNVAIFGAAQGKLNRLTPDLVLTIEQIVQSLNNISGPIWLVGNLGKIITRLDLSQGNYHLADEIHSHPYGLNVARLGLSKIQAGLTDDPLALTPAYSHKPNIREYKS